MLQNLLVLDLTDYLVRVNASSQKEEKTETIVKEEEYNDEDDEYGGIDFGNYGDEDGFGDFADDFGDANLEFDDQLILHVPEEQIFLE